MSTNVCANELNYDAYSASKYDGDILRSIPGHIELHKKLSDFVKKKFSSKKEVRILELGVGTGLTGEVILKKLPNSEYVGVDFSENMLSGAKLRLKKFNSKFIFGDFAKVRFPKNVDLVVSVVGIHHQKTGADKKKLFKKIANCLVPNGFFVFGDLVTFRSESEAALNDALHFHFLVDNALDLKSLKEWAFHHKYLNCLSPLEDQIVWLKQAGFGSVKVVFKKFNTVLIIAQK